MPVGSLIFMEVHPANYIDGDNLMITGLKNLLNFGFEKFSIVTSGVSPNQKIFQNGYKSAKNVILIKSTYKNIPIAIAKEKKIIE